jgi:hypothetical protein
MRARRRPRPPACLFLPRARRGRALLLLLAALVAAALVDGVAGRASPVSEQPSGAGVVSSVPSGHGRAPARAADTITPGGLPVTVTISTPGTSAQVTFTANANDRVSLEATNSTISRYQIKLLKPDGSILVSSSSSLGTGNSYAIDATTLPVAGTYTLKVIPASTYTGSVTLTLYSVVDATGTTTSDGGPFTITTTIPGQRGLVTFPGVAGRRISITSGSVAISGARVSVLKPDGSPLAAQSSYLTSNYLPIDAVTLPTSGSYTIVLDAVSDNTGSAALSLHDVPPDVIDAIVLNGPSRSETVTTPGQNMYVTFDVPEFDPNGGASIKLTVSGNMSCHLKIFRPDGSILIQPASVYCGSSHVFSSQVLEPGQHTIFIDPYVASTGTVTLTVEGPPTIDTPITIVGDPVVGSSLALVSDWVGASSISQQWFRCGLSGLPIDCTPIDGATATSYVATAEDVGSELEVTQTATNAFGLVTARSAPTQPIVSNALLLTYAPELRLDSSETYSADSAAELTDYHGPDGANVLTGSNDWDVYASADPQFFGEAKLSLDFLNGTVYVGGFGDGLSPSSGDKVNAVGESNAIYELDYNTMHPEPQYANKVYGRVVTTDSGYVVIQYWFFYYDNPYALLGNVGVHEGDWEGITLLFDSAGNPLAAEYNQHVGGETCSWSDTPKLGTHPIVYVAAGSHASYFWPGSHHTQGLIDAADGARNPPEDPSIIDIGQGPPWLDWPGHWGGSTGANGEASPPGPAQQESPWYNPVGWVFSGASCTMPPGMRALSNTGIRRRFGNMASAVPPLPHIVAKLRTTSVVVKYRFDSWPKAPSRRPWLLFTSVVSADARYARLTKRTVLKRREGTIVQARGAGPKPLHLVYSVMSRKYTRTPPHSVRIN